MAAKIYYQEDCNRFPTAFARKVATIQVPLVVEKYWKFARL